MSDLVKVYRVSQPCSQRTRRFVTRVVTEGTVLYENPWYKDPD